MTTRENRTTALLAAAIAYALRQKGEGDQPAVRWSRTTHPHMRRINWNPRRVASGWRLDGRLKQHGAAPNEI